MKLTNEQFCRNLLSMVLYCSTNHMSNAEIALINNDASEVVFMWCYDLSAPGIDDLPKFSITLSEAMNYIGINRTRIIACLANRSGKDRIKMHDILKREMNKRGLCL